MTIIELFQEIKNGDLIRVKEILSLNPKLLNEYYYGVTPFMYSIECEHEDIALELGLNPKTDYSLRDNLDSGLLEKAIEYKMYKVVELICKNIKKSSLNDTISGSSETYLTASIKADDSNVSIALIKGNVDVNRPNNQKEYPIQLVLKYNKVDVLREMLKVNDFYLGTLDNGYNALLDACENDLTDAAILLIENGADLNVCDQDQLWTPLMHAICNSNEVIVAKLLENNCDLSAVDFNGNTPVHLAVLTENDFILKLLLKRNPQKNIRNKEDLTPLEIAKLNEDENSIKLLL